MSLFHNYYNLQKQKMEQIGKSGFCAAPTFPKAIFIQGDNSDFNLIKH